MRNLAVPPKWKHGKYRFFLHRLAQELHKTVEELLELPASELSAWENYFDIYPFTQDREDFRMSRILEMLNINTQGLGYKNKQWDFFIPDYLGTKDITAISEKEQIAKEIEFTETYTRAMQRLKDA